MKVISIRLHIGDLQSKTFDMDTREFGAHLRLIIAHYQKGENGLPCDDKILARIAGVTLKIWKKISPAALKGFHIVPHPGGQKEYACLVHDRCLEELKWIEEKSAKNRANALKRKR